MEVKNQNEFDKEMEIALRRIKESPLAKFLNSPPQAGILLSQGEHLLESES